MSPLRYNKPCKLDFHKKGDNMNRNLFVAWYCLGVLTLCLVLFLILLPFGAKGATGAFGLLGLIGFLPFILLSNNPRWEKFDERDALFWQRAVLSGLALGCAAVGPIIALLVLVFHFLLEVNSVPLGFLVFPLYCGMVIGVFSFALSLIHSYRKEKHIEHGGQNVS